MQQPSLLDVFKFIRKTLIVLIYFDRRNSDYVCWNITLGMLSIYILFLLVLIVTILFIIMLISTNISIIVIIIFIAVNMAIHTQI